MTNTYTHGAFTLIELLVVVSIIAMLMGLAVPAFQKVQESAKKTQAKNDLVQIVTAVNAFYTEYGKYPLPSTRGRPPSDDVLSWQ
jgi:prepilin-type N-terminal cleavage/methylation domain-containing protein